jgi:hypothetical protein
VPLIFRAMKMEDGKPAVAARRDSLGVIAGEPPIGDIPVGDHGIVAPDTGGMSVAPSWKDLPPSRIPKRLKSVFRAATGSNQYHCWFMGEGNFASGNLTEGLYVRQDKATHGLVEPESAMLFDTFQELLANTRDQWRLIAEDSGR